MTDGRQSTGEGDGSGDGTMIKGRDIVCMSFQAWDSHWATPQQLMSRLAKHNRVLFVEQPITPLSPFTGRHPGVWKQVRRWWSGPRREGDLTAAAPPPILPFRSSRIVNRINAWIIGRWLARQVKRLGFHDPIFWNLQPAMPGVGAAVKPSLLLYHCVDDFAGAPFWWNQEKPMRAREAESCREADLIICTGRKLVEERRHYTSQIHFVGEGADVPLFARAGDPATVIPDDIAKLPGKIVGYIGVIDFRLDADLLKYLTEREPGWSIAIIGPVHGDARDVDELKALPNVHFFGNRQIEDLPRYLKAFDVCMIPYILNDFTHHIFPLKLYEYMASGRPIVATAMEEMALMAGPELTIGYSKESFHAAVRDAIASDTPEKRTARRTASEQHSWDHRVEEISELIERTPTRRAS
jgi:glycosyltransferase involved in cell wall biosynthesis